MLNAVTLVWGLLRLAPMICYALSYFLGSRYMQQAVGGELLIGLGTLPSFGKLMVLTKKYTNRKFSLPHH